MLVATALARFVHRRRLRGAGVVGAWQHAAEALALRVGPADAADTTDVLADRIERLAGVPARPLADAAQEAAFGRTVLVAAPPEGVDAPAWRAALDVERRLRSGVPWSRRATWWVGPAPWHVRRADRRRR